MNGSMNASLLKGREVVQFKAVRYTYVLNQHLKYIPCVTALACQGLELETSARPSSSARKVHVLGRVATEVIHPPDELQ